MKRGLLYSIICMLLVATVAMGKSDREKTERTPKVDIPKVIIPKAIIPKAPDIPEVSIPEITHSQIKVRENEEWAVIILSTDVLFDFDKWNIRPDAQEALQEVLKALTGRYAGLPIQIHGHTDAKGTEAYNLKLSMRRAEAVKVWFVEQGVPAGRMSTFAHGESQPVAPNTKKDGSDNPEGRQLNRRVEIFIHKHIRKKQEGYSRYPLKTVTIVSSGFLKYPLASS